MGVCFTKSYVLKTWVSLSGRSQRYSNSPVLSHGSLGAGPSSEMQRFQNSSTLMGHGGLFCSSYSLLGLDVVTCLATRLWLLG